METHGYAAMVGVKGTEIMSSCSSAEESLWDAGAGAVTGARLLCSALLMCVQCAQGRDFTGLSLLGS